MWCWRRLLRVSQTARRSPNPKGNQPWIFIGRTGAEAEPPILWPPDAKRLKRLFRKDPHAGKNWGQEDKGVAKDEMVGWHHWLNAYEFEQAPGVGEGQGSLVCCMQSMGSQRVGHNWAIEQQQQKRVSERLNQGRGNGIGEEEKDSQKLLIQQWSWEKEVGWEWSRVSTYAVG